MRTTIIALFVAALLIAGPAWAGEHPEHPKSSDAPAEVATPGKGALDGKVFVGSLVKSGAASGDQDKLSFKNGTFVSAACIQYGFHEAPYTAEEKGGVVTFTASVKNAGGETMRWNGTVRDGVLEGTAVHTTASGETTYAFKGKAGTGQAPPKGKEHPKKSEHPEHPK